jgi:hypothetical protein
MTVLCCGFLEQRGGDERRVGKRQKISELTLVNVCAVVKIRGERDSMTVPCCLYSNGVAAREASRKEEED